MVQTFPGDFTGVQDDKNTSSDKISELNFSQLVPGPRMTQKGAIATLNQLTQKLHQKGLIL